MTCREELSEILERHRMWMIGEEGGERADLHGAKLHGAYLQGESLEDADLQHSDLQHSDFRDAILRGTKVNGAVLHGTKLRRADMRGANIDYASWPLWCGSLQAYVDDRIAIQLLYHTLSVVQHSPYVSEDVKAKLLTPEIVSLANRFHRVLECGEIKEWEEGTK